jgi:hypothetical protein
MLLTNKKQMKIPNKFMRKVIIVSFIIGSIYGSFHLGRATTEPEKVYADREVIKVEKLRFEDIPLLMKICKAESENRQFNSKGDVLRGIKNPSDIGYCQISESINNDDARRLGYDIYTEQGNKDYAVHLFLEKGYAPWMASHKSNTPNGWSIE